MRKFLLLFLSVLMLITSSPVMAQETSETSIFVPEEGTSYYPDSDETSIDVHFGESTDVTSVDFTQPVNDDKSGSTHEADEYQPHVQAIPEVTTSNVLLVATADSSIFTEKDTILSEYDGLYMVAYQTEADLLEAMDRLSAVADFVERDVEVYAAEGEGNSEEITYTEEENPFVELDKELSKDETFAETENPKVKVVALLDSGVREDSHVIGRASMLGDFVGDDYGHGNEMLDAMIEVNPDIKVLSIKVLDENGKGSISSIIAGMEYAIEQGVDVINLSLSSYATQKNSILREYVLKANENGIKVVGAAGNNDKDAKYFIPANIEEVVVVGMGTGKNEVKYPSNYGSSIDFLVDTDSTSKATAIVSALIKNWGMPLDYLSGNFVLIKDKNAGEVTPVQPVSGRDFAAARTITSYTCAQSMTTEIGYHHSCDDPIQTMNSHEEAMATWGSGCSDYPCSMCNDKVFSNYGAPSTEPYGPYANEGGCDVTTIESYDYSVFAASPNTSSIFANAFGGDAIMKVKRIERASANKSGSKVVSDPMSQELIYAWIEGDTMKWYCADRKVYINPNMNYMFLDFQKLESLDLSAWDMSKVTSMGHTYTRTHALSSITMAPDSKLLVTDNGLGGYWAKEGWDVDTEYQVVIDANGRQQAKKVAKTTLKAAGAAGNTLPDTFEKYWNTTKDAGTYVLTDPEDHYWVLVGSTVGGGMSEIHHLDTVVRSYCSGHHYSGAKQGQDMAYYKMELKTKEQIEAYFYPNKGSNFGPFASNTIDAVKTVLWADAPADPLGLKSRFNLNDEQVHRCIQQLIWFIEKDSHKDYNSAYLHIYNLRDRYGSVYSEDVLNRMVQAMKYIWDNARYNNIPNKDKMVLYAYYSISGYQNQMSVAGLNDEEYGGVKVKKVDPNGDPLQGAQFTVYDSSNKAVATMVSDHEGKAMLCEYNKNGGLKVGQTYTVKETKAPNGYKLNRDVFTFTVTAPNVTVSTGHRNGANEIETMIFTNEVDVPTPAGGLRIKKTSAETGTGLFRAVFGVYDSNNKEVVKLYTDQKGIAQTANNFLPLGTYTVKELEAPFGFALDTTVRTVNINKDKTMFDLNLTNPAMRTSAVIEAVKDVTGIVPEGYQLAANQFEFELVNAQTGKVIKTVANDAEGKIRFEMEYNANDVGGNITYWLREKDSANPRYMKDTHTEEIMVSFRVTDGELFADVVYENGEAIFTNTRKSIDISGRIWFDSDKDGIQDDPSEEPPVESYDVCLYRKTPSKFGGDPITVEGATYYPAYDPEYGTKVECMKTNAEGEYLFKDVDTGEYVVVVDISEKALISPKDQGSDDTKDSDADKLQTHAIVNVKTKEWSQIEVFEAYEHNDIGLLILPEKEVHNENDEDVNNEYVARDSALTYIIKFENPFNETRTFTIEDVVPENTEFLDAENDGVYADGKVTWIKSYGPKEDIVVKWRAKAIGEEKHIVNEATVTFGKTTLKTNKVDNYTPMDPIKNVYDEDGNDVDREMRLAKQRLTYRIKVKNSRDIPYVGTLTDEVPEGVEVVNISNDGKLADGVITWDLKFAGMEEKELSFTVVIKDEAKLSVQANDATLHFDKMKVVSNEVETPVWDNPVKAVKDAEGNDIHQLLVNEGEILYYEITFTNPANDTKKFTVRDYLPEHTEFVDANLGGQYDSTSGLIEWVLDVASKEEVVVKWQAKTVGVKTHIVNKATVSVDRLELETNEVENWVPDNPVKQVLDELDRDANYNTLNAQDTRTLKYKLTFNNNSTLKKEFTITDKLDKVLVFKEASHDGVYDEEAHTITWKMTLEPDTYMTVEFVAEPDNVSTGSKILNDFNVRADLYNNNSNIVTNYIVDNPETVQIQGVKKWLNSKGEEMSDNLPESITVRLYADGSEVASRKVDESTNWEFKFLQVPKHMFGKEVVYTIKEDKIAGFDTTVKGDAKTGFTIENKRNGKGYLIVEYRDIQTKEIIAETINAEGLIGEPYSTAIKNIEGYDYKQMDDKSDPASGNYIDGTIKVIYLYGKKLPGTDDNQGKLIVEYRDIDTNNIIADTVTSTGKVGDQYSTSAKNITNYSFVKVDASSAPTSGQYKEGTLKVIYLYKKNTSTTPNDPTTPPGGGTTTTTNTNTPKGYTITKTGLLGENIVLPICGAVVLIGLLAFLLKKKKEVK